VKIASVGGLWNGNASKNSSLCFHDAPKVIDYISVDIEGSEIRVLSEFFEKNSKYEVKCWTVEHNFRNDRKSLRDLFTDHGYEVVNEELSYRDYWFIKIN
jgi:hypothetical protein